MKIEKNRVLENKGRRSIVYDAFYNATNQPKPIIVFCHGYKGFKDWGSWHLVAETFAKAGFFFLKFNFSHNGGTVTEPIDFPDLEAFANNNYTTELEDLERVISHISTSKKYMQEADATRISLIGHSRGGGIVLIKAEENSDVKNVITWAGVSDYKARFNEDSDNFKTWKKTGITYVENGRTKQQMPHYFQFYKNYIENEKRLNIKRAVKNLKIPQLIIHGAEDATVPETEAQLIHSWNPESELKVIDQANHVFGASHPYEKKEMPDDLMTAVQVSIAFLRKL